MKVKEFIEELKKFPQDLEVVEMDKYENYAYNDNQIDPMLAVDEPFYHNNKLIYDEKSVVL